MMIIPGFPFVKQGVKFVFNLYIFSLVNLQKEKALPWFFLIKAGLFFFTHF